MNSKTDKYMPHSCIQRHDSQPDRSMLLVSSDRSASGRKKLLSYMRRLTAS